MISGSFDVLDFFLFCIAALLSPPVIIAQTKIPNSDDVQGRRFGGYRIVPKACNSTNDDTLPSGVCMFNNDCTRMNGTAGGSCTDGFLFGTCCILTEGSYYISVPLSLNPAATTSGGLVIPQTVSTTPKAHVASNLGDTVLFHKDGTLVHGSYKPVDFLFNKRPDLFLTNETYEEPFGEHFVPERVSTVKPTTMVWPTTKDYTKPYTYNSIKDMIKSTTNFRTSTISKYPFTDNRKSTTEPSYFYTSDNNYNLVSNTQTDYQKIKDSTNQESIYHILNILNNSAPDHLSTPSKNSYITLPSTTPDSIYSVQNKYSPGTNYPKDSTVQSASTYLVTKKQTLVSIKPIHAPCKSSTNLNKYGILTSSNDPNCPPGSVSSINDDIIKGQSNFYNKFIPQFSTTTKVPHEPNKVISNVYSNLHNQNSGNIHKFTTSKPNTHYVNYLTVSSNPYKPTKRPQPGSLHTSINTTQYVHLTGIHVTPDANVTPKPGSNHVFDPIPTVILLETPNTTPVVKTSKRPSTVKTPTNSIISINSNPNIATFRPTSTTYNLGNKTPTSLITSVAPIGISTNSHNSHVRPVSENLGSIYSVAKPHPKPEDTITVTSVPLFEPVNPQLTVPTQALQLTKNSTEILVAFPPNRDPSANISHLRPDPEIVSWISAKPDDTVDLGENNYNDLIEDATFDTKVHTFVEKIVQNLQGNFVDLENVLIDGSTGSNFTNTPTKKPNKTPSKKPSKKPSTSAVTNATKPLITRPPPRPESVTVPVKTTLTNTTSKPSLKPTIVEVSSHLDAELETDSINKACGIRPLMKNGRIVGGKGATFGEWPWQVLVREATWLGLFTKNKCGGVLLTNKYVITAAHCQPGFLASLIAVFGEYDISGEIESRRSVSRNVRRVIVHRYYNAATFENDVSLLELESAIQFDKHIIPICMPKDSDDYTGMIATVTGWGRLKYGGGVPSVLQEVHVPVIDNNVCQEMFHTAGHSKTILNSFICAGYANGQRDSCEGDSGGPLMVEREDGHWVLAGTVSHGIKCAAPYLPGVYMRTTYYKPWIQTITGVKDL